jgi:hypothetical protein
MPWYGTYRLRCQVHIKKFYSGEELFRGKGRDDYVIFIQVITYPASSIFYWPD